MEFFEVLEIQKMDIAQKACEKSEVICLVIIFTLRAVVMKISKRLTFVFFADDGKTLGTVGAKHVRLKDCIGFFQKMVWLII